MKEWLWNEPKLLAHSLRVSEKVLKCYTGFLTDALLAYFQGPQERHPDLVLERDSQRRKPAPSERHGLAQLQVPRRVHDRPSHLTLDTTKTSFVDFFFQISLKAVSSILKSCFECWVPSENAFACIREAVYWSWLRSYDNIPETRF